MKELLQWRWEGRNWIEQKTEFTKSKEVSADSFAEACPRKDKLDIDK